MRNFTGELCRLGFAVPRYQPFTVQEGRAECDHARALIQHCRSSKSLGAALCHLVAVGDDRAAFLGLVALIARGWVPKPLGTGDDFGCWLDYLAAKGCEPDPWHDGCVSLEERCAWLCSTGQGSTSQALHHAARSGNEVMLRLLLEDGAMELNATDEEGLTAIVLAIAHGHRQCVTMLANMPDIDLVTGRPIELAIRQGRGEIAQLLLALPGAAANPMELIDAAIQAGLESIVSTLLKTSPPALLQDTNPLVAAIRHRNLPLIKTILECDDDLNINIGQPLCFAVRSGFADVVETLLAHAKGLDLAQGAPIELAIELGHCEIVLKLLARTDKTTLDADGLLKSAIDKGHTEMATALLCSDLCFHFDRWQPLNIAIQHKDVPMLKALLPHAHRFDVNAQEPLWLAVERRHPEMVSLLLEWCPNLDVNAGRTLHIKKAVGAPESIFTTPLARAVMQDQIEIASLLAKHPLTNPNLGNPLQHAIERGNSQMVRVLLTMPTLQKEAINEHGQSMVMVAVKRENITALRDLLEAGWPINQTDATGLHPLHVAIDTRCVETLKLLLGTPGISINTRDRTHGTPLHCAIGYGFTEGVKLLLAAKDIDLGLRDNSGHTPIYLARSLAKTWKDREAQQEIKKLLEDRTNPLAFLKAF
jgi:ankyrin repeat protein